MTRSTPSSPTCEASRAHRHRPSGSWIDRPLFRKNLGPERTVHYMAALRDTMKGLVTGTVVSRNRDDIRRGLQMATSGRHCVFFEADQSRILVIRVLHDRMDCRRHLEVHESPDEGR